MASKLTKVLPHPVSMLMVRAVFSSFLKIYLGTLYPRKKPREWREMTARIRLAPEDMIVDELAATTEPHISETRTTEAAGVSCPQS